MRTNIDAASAGGAEAFPVEVDLAAVWDELADHVVVEDGLSDALDAFGSSGSQYPEFSASAQSALVAGYQAGLQARDLLSKGSASALESKRLRKIVTLGDRCSEYLLGSVFRLVRAKVWERARKRFGDTWATQLLPELLADGHATALEAASSYDASRGPTFASWVAERLDQDMADHMAKHGRMGSTPQAWGRLMRILHHAKPELEELLGRSATVDELQVVMRERCRTWSEEHLSATQQELTGEDRQRAIDEKLRKQGMAKALTELPQILAAMQPEAAFESSYGEDGQLTLGDRTAGPDSVEAQACAGEDMTEYGQTLAVGTGHLVGEERDMVLTYLGLGDEDGGTYRKVAQQFGVPDLKVRHLVRDTQSRLRAPHAQYAHLTGGIEAQFDTPSSDDAPVKAALKRRRRSPLITSEKLLAEAIS